MSTALTKTPVVQPTILERVITIPPTARLERLREVLLSQKIVLRIDHARTYTRVMKETEGEPMVTRRAKAFCAVVNEMPITIEPDEFFVGRADATWTDRQVSPEEGAMVEKLIDYYKSVGKPIISEADERELREEIIPYWKGPKGDWRRIRRAQDYEFVPEKYRIPPIHRISTATSPDRGYIHWGHHTVNYEKVLKKGYLGIKKDAEERLARVDPTDPGQFPQAAFLRGVIIAMDASARIGKRYAVLARSLAETERDSGRKAELVQIAEACAWVPANPARTFHEALQSYWFRGSLPPWRPARLHQESPSYRRC